jgi:protein-L-isoaspartate(D-aspartate) O-methyltransferase
MKKVPRHLFIPAAGQRVAYGDHPVAIGHRQTISQPYIVAYMTQALDPQPGDHILEIGTGSGYQAAVLAELAGRVKTIEIVAPLGARAKELLNRLGYTNIDFHVGDGYAGWPAGGSFDGIMLTAAPPKIPQPLLDQLKVGGSMVAPVGKGVQQLVHVTRTQDGFEKKIVMGVRFVPMTGKAQEEPSASP